MTSSVSAMSLLRMDRVGKIFPMPWGSLQVLSNVDLVVEPGEFLVVTGPSGSGKTTLLHLAGLLDQPTSGSLMFLGQNVQSLSERDLRVLRATRIGLVFQQFHLLSRRTVLENVRLRFRYLDMSRDRVERLCREALDRVGLGDRWAQPVRLLSGGEMQRVAIARAIAWSPSLLVVDEPTGNLDPATGRSVMAQLLALHREGITVLLATHNPEWVACGTRHLCCRNGTVGPAPVTTERIS